MPPKKAPAKAKAGAGKAAKASSSKATEAKKPSPPPAEPETKQISFKQLGKVLLDDETGEIKKSGKCVLLIDPEGRATSFLQYREVNYICSADSNQMQAETLRRALIGAIRYGKKFLLDMLDTDMMDVCEGAFNKIKPNLFKDIISGELLKNESFLELVKPEDGDGYSAYDFIDQLMANYCFILATKKAVEDVPKDWLEKFYPIHVVMT